VVKLARPEDLYLTSGPTSQTKTISLPALRAPRSNVFVRTWQSTSLINALAKFQTAARGKFDAMEGLQTVFRGKMVKRALQFVRLWTSKDSNLQQLLQCGIRPIGSVRAVEAFE
jgi:hypothetical protein